MIVTCKNCGDKHQDQQDIFCTNCGAKLGEDGGLRTMQQGNPEAGGVPTARLPDGTSPLELGNARLNLHIIRSGQILPLGGPGEYIVGRVSDGQSILPDIDLEPYDAYESGVSRLHARIKVEPQNMWITDLGSANGTRVNNQKLSPHQDYPLSNNDVVRLGRLSLQALVGTA